jgi:hypothetical protein
MPMVQGNQPLFDLASYARPGPGRRDRLSPGEIAQISRTVRRVPEVMVKVLSRGGQDLKAVGRHIDYLRDRDDGEREVETDDGGQLSGECVTRDLLEDWNLELEVRRNRSDLGVRSGGSQKLVHKLLFSMPAGTPPQKVLAAVKNLAREEFGLKHRYAMVLHTDEPHPHVHMVLKAVSEQGVRLNIKKATLRHWRSEFARNLRLFGVEANATERAVRGESRKALKDGIYRASLRGDSTYLRAQASAVAAELSKGDLRDEPGKHKVVKTRREVVSGWHGIASHLLSEGHHDLAREVAKFVKAMPPALTHRGYVAERVLNRVPRRHTLEPPRSR